MVQNSFKEKATSSEFLQKRIHVNQNSKNNFEHWSINTMPKMKIESKILDLGCGTGKQIESFSAFFSKKCSYFGCDISTDSINFVKENYKSNPKLTLINDSFDNINSFISDNTKFDLIYSFYALYYTENLKKLINDVYNKLNDGAIFWIVMPYKNTNVEIFKVLENIYKIDEKVFYSINGFSNDIISISSDLGFKNIDISLFENKINFESISQLLEYIQNTTFYNKEYEQEVEDAVKTLFYDNFSLTKEVISIKLTK